MKYGNWFRKLNRNENYWDNPAQRLSRIFLAPVFNVNVSSILLCGQLRR